MTGSTMIYKIRYSTACDEFHIEIQLNGFTLRVFSGSIAGSLPEAGLSVNEGFMQLRYNIGLSSYEIISFIANKYVWKDFIASPFHTCMIVDENTSMQYDTQGLLKELADAEDDWDVYFPFDRSSGSKEELKEQYFLGQVWGLDIYFLTKHGAGTLNGLDIIKQPLDEEMLELSEKGELNIYCSETVFCTYTENEARRASRNDATKRAILAINHWENEEKEQVGLLLQSLNSIAEKAGVQLVLGYGSLLGHVRHGGIMPWDDDVDLLLEEDGLEKLLPRLGEEEGIRCGSANWGGVKYHKIWLESGKEIPGFDHTFPFVDVWSVKRDGGHIVTHDGVKIPSEYYYPLKKVEFENSDIYCPAFPQECLSSFYRDWRTDIVIFPWRHKLELPANFQLNAKITVDTAGRMV
ncbi:LicD family protein [Chitinophaga sp. YIM B06452]|uniref:LicD family protein n=1 Tax=Chitinophaga sp. YIM B06452 TaxID=3082158 RepID=UPI0031FE7E5D